jgi:hypothetical protein
MLYTVLEETERAVVKVEQYTYTIALIHAACNIVLVLIIAQFAVAVEATSIGTDEPGVSALCNSIADIGVEVGPGHTDTDIKFVSAKITRIQKVHLPIVLARR